MEKVSFVKNGVLRLPPGFRFHPTDEELVVQYLRRKVYSCPLPATIIPDVEVCKSDPWDLPGDSEQERYFFSTREAKYPNGNRSNRATFSGYWKATGIDRQIATSKGNQVVGMKKTLVFYRGKPPSGSKTDWIMHEYRLVTADTANSAPQKMNLNQSPVLPMENWVLCRIFLKKRNSKNDEDDMHAEVPSRNYRDGVVGRSKVRTTAGRPVYYDFMTRERGDDEGNGGRRGSRSCLADLNVVPSASSSGSSGITELSSGNNNNNNDSNTNADDHEESSCNSLQLFGTKP